MQTLLNVCAGLEAGEGCNSFLLAGQPSSHILHCSAMIVLGLETLQMKCTAPEAAPEETLCGISAAGLIPSRK